MVASFSGMRQYFGWLIFMHKVTSKIRFDVLLGRSDVFRSKIDLQVTLKINSFKLV